MIIALARASDEIALILSFMRWRLRRRSARFASASARLPPVSIWMAMAMAKKSISGLLTTRAMRQSAASSGSPSCTRSLIARKCVPTGAPYSCPTVPTHSITGRPERMPRMMVSMASGSCFMKRLASMSPRKRTPRSTSVMPLKSAGTTSSATGRPLATAPPTVRTAAATSESAMKPGDREVEAGALDVGAQPHGVEQRHEAGEVFGDAHQGVVLGLLPQEVQPQVLDVELARHAPPADPGEALAVPRLHAQHHRQHEEADPDQHADRGDEGGGRQDQVDGQRQFIASSSRLPRPKYSARGMKCGRRWLHSNRPEMLPSAFSPS